jgi:hypothetical protein
MDYNDAHLELINWGRAVHDGWLREFLLYAPPPTSKGYLAPIVAYDDPEQPRGAIDFQMAELTERVVIDIGSYDYQSYRVLVYWYPKLMSMMSDDVHLDRENKIKLLSKHMATSYRNAEAWLTEAVCQYKDRRLHRGIISLYSSPGQCH